MCCVTFYVKFYGRVILRAFHPVCIYGNLCVENMYRISCTLGAQNIVYFWTTFTSSDNINIIY